MKPYTNSDYIKDLVMGYLVWLAFIACLIGIVKGMML